MNHIFSAGPSGRFFTRGSTDSFFSPHPQEFAV